MPRLLPPLSTRPFRPPGREHRRRTHAPRSGGLAFAALALIVFACAPVATAGPGGSPSPDRIPAVDPGGGPVAPPRPVIRRPALTFHTYTLFIDPSLNVVTKEFSFVHNEVPAPTLGPGRKRQLFHLVYQRSAGPQQSERTFGHAWSPDLKRWSVDTLAFSVDSTAWNALHVWSPSIVFHGGRTYMFYTGVDANEDQSIGFVSTALLDTTNTEWDYPRVKVLGASDTKWAVPDPSTYSGQTQFRDPYVMEDPEDPSRLLLFYTAHDSIDFRTGRGGLAAGVAVSEPGSLTSWTDRGYFAKLHPAVTKVDQLEGPHVFYWPGTPGHWCQLYTNAGTPYGETGSTTIRYSLLEPGASLADTSGSRWTTPAVLQTTIGDDVTAYGWSGTEHLRVGGTDLLAGFTAWGPIYQGIAITRMNFTGGALTLGDPVLTAVDEYRSDTRAVTLRVAGNRPGAREVRFLMDSPRALAATLEILDVAGRRVASLLSDGLAAGGSSVSWPLAAAGAPPVPSGVYFARLAFAGGVRVARLTVVR